MRMRTISFTALLMLSSVTAHAQETKKESTPQARFQQAWYHEMAEGRFEDALEVYEGLAGNAELPDLLRARALFRAGVCLRKLQRKDDSRKTFERAIEEFPEVQEIVRAHTDGLVETAPAPAETDAGWSGVVRLAGLRYRLGLVLGRRQVD